MYRNLVWGYLRGFLVEFWSSTTSAQLRIKYGLSMSEKPVTPPGFGSFKAGPVWQWMVSLCHQSRGPLISRVCAPIVRKLVVRHFGEEPVDLTLDGVRLRCQVGNNYSEKKFIFTPWRFNVCEREFLRQELSDGGVFIDIGANVGLYTLTAAQALRGRKGRIIAIEPNPPVFERLRFNLAANPGLFDATNVRLDVLEIGIADCDTHFDLYVDRDNFGQSSILEKGRDNPGHRRDATQTRIRCRPLLDVLGELDVQQVDALKIDIEGAEDMALMPYLERAPRSLLAHLVIVESSEHLWSRDLFGKFADLGYRRVFQDKSNSVFELPPETAKQEPINSGV